MRIFALVSKKNVYDISGANRTLVEGTLKRKKAKDDASGIFCDVNNFHKLCIFSAE